MSERANYDWLNYPTKILCLMKRRFMLETSHSERLTRRYMCEMKMRFLKMKMTPPKMKMAPLKMKMAPLKMKMRGVFTVVHRPR